MIGPLLFIHINLNLTLYMGEWHLRGNIKSHEFPFTTYYGLLRAIPTEWKSALQVKAGVHGD